MPNQLIAVGFSSTTRLAIFDYDTNTWTDKQTSPVAIGTGSGRQMAAWDGFYFYYVGTDRKLYRYDPVSNAVPAPVFGGNTVHNNSFPWADCFCDGTRIWSISNDNIFRVYNIATDTIQTIGLPAPMASGSGSSTLCWDYGTTIYFLKNSDGSSGNAWLSKYDMTTGTFTALAQPPYGTFNFGSSSRTWYANGFLYGLAASGHVYKAQGPNFSVWVQDTISTISAGSNTTMNRAIPIDSDKVLLANHWGYQSPNAAVQYGVLQLGTILAAYTLNFQPLFTFLEADGITPQLSPEPIGGSLARFYAGQQSGVYQFALKAAAPRTTVQLSVIPNAAVDITANIQIAPALGGPWSNVANLGAYAANQVKPYYLKFLVPSPTTPGQKLFTLLATST